MENLRKSIIR